MSFCGCCLFPPSSKPEPREKFGPRDKFRNKGCRISSLWFRACSLGTWGRDAHTYSDRRERERERKWKSKPRSEPRRVSVCGVCSVPKVPQITAIESPPPSQRTTWDLMSGRQNLVDGGGGCHVYQAHIDQLCNFGRERDDAENCGMGRAIVRGKDSREGDFEFSTGRRSLNSRLRGENSQCRKIGNEKSNQFAIF